MADGASLSGILGHVALTTPAGKVATGAAVTSALREYEKEMFSRSTNASRQVQCPRIALPACTRVLKVLVEHARALAEWNAMAAAFDGGSGGALLYMS